MNNPAFNQILADALEKQKRREMKLYQNGDRCPCCGTVLEGKSREWLAEFSQLVGDLGLPPWPGLAESWDAFTMMEEDRK